RVRRSRKERDEGLHHLCNGSDLVSQVLEGFGSHGRRDGRGTVWWKQSRVVEQPPITFRGCGGVVPRFIGVGKFEGDPRQVKPLAAALVLIGLVIP
ncbi:unnamed protein product, partial [Musa textilis]